MGSDGDGRCALADAGDDAGLGHRGDALIAAFPGKVGGVVVSSVERRTVDLEGRGAANVDVRGGGDDVEALHRDDDGDGHLGVDAGAVGGKGANGDRAAAQAGDGGGAVGVADDAGVAVAHAPVEGLGHIVGGAVAVVGDSLHAQGLAHADLSLLRVHQRKLDLAHRDGDVDEAGLLDAVVRGGGDRGHALAHGGDDAGLRDSGDIFIAALPGEVPGGVVGGVERRAVDLEGQRLAGKHGGGQGDDVEALHRDDDADGHLRVDAGAVGGKGADLDRAGAQADDGGGAIAVIGDAGVAGIAHAPLDILRDVGGGAVGVVGDGAHAQTFRADAHFRAIGVDKLQLDLSHRDGDGDGAGGLQAVVGSGGDNSRAFAHSGDQAGPVHGDHVFIAADPGKVRGRVIGGVGRRAVGQQLQLLADKEVRRRGDHPAALYGHDDGHGDLAAHAGAVLGHGIDLRRAGAHAAHRAAAVKVGAHLRDPRIAGDPLEVLRHILAGVAGAKGGGAQRQVAGINADLRLRAVGGDEDLVGGYGDRHQTGVHQAVVGGGGDDGRAVANAGDNAVFHGGDARVAGLPGEVFGEAVGGVAGRAVGPQRHSLANEQLLVFRDVEAGHGHDHGDDDRAAHAGAIRRDGVDVDRTGADAAHGAGAVGIGAHLGDVGIAGLPVEHLTYVHGVALGVKRRGAQGQVAGADVDVGGLLVRRLDHHFGGRHGHGDDAQFGKAVVRSDGDGGGADAVGGQLALFVHGDDMAVAADPGKVRSGLIGGIGGGAVERELGLFADEQLHHFLLDVEALHRHDDAHGDLAVDAGAVGGVGIDAHGPGGDAGHGAGAIAVGVHAGIARVGGFPCKRLLHAVGGAVSAVGGGAQRQIARTDGDVGLAHVHRIDHDAAHGVGDRHQAGSGAAVDRGGDQAHYAGALRGEIAVGVHGGGAGHRLRRPEDGVGLGVFRGDHGGKARGLPGHDLGGRRQRDAGRHLAHVDLDAHGVEGTGAGGDGHHAGGAQSMHQRAGLRRRHGGDGLVARSPGHAQIERLGRAELEAQRGVLVEVEDVLGAHGSVVIVEDGAQDGRVQRHFRAKDGARGHFAALGADAGQVVVAELFALGIPAQAGIAAGEHPAVEHLAFGRLGHGQAKGGLRRDRGERAAAQQLVIAAVEGDNDALFAFLRRFRGGKQRGQVQARLAGGGNGVAIFVKGVHGRGIGDQGRIGSLQELLEAQRAGAEQRAVCQLPAGKDHAGIGAGGGQFHGVALAERQRQIIARVAQEQLDGIGGLDLRALGVGAIAGEAHRRGQHQAGKAALVKGHIVRHIVVGHSGGEGRGKHQIAARVPAVDGAAGAEDGEIVAQALAGVVVEYVVAVALVGLVAAGKGDGLVRRVLVHAHARAGARPGAGVQHDFDDVLLRLALQHRHDGDLHRGQAVVKHDARHGDHLEDLVIRKRRGVRVHQRGGAGGGVEIAAHVVFHAPAGKHLALEQSVDDGEGDALAAAGEALGVLVARGVRDGDVEDDELFLIHGNDQRRAHGHAVGGNLLRRRTRVDERFQFGIADGSLVRRPALAARERPSGAGHAVRQGVGKGHVRIAGGERHRADGLAAVGEQQLQVRLVGLGRAVGGVVGAHFQALVAALGHRQAGGHSAEALHQLFIGKRGAGLKLDAIQIRAAVDAAPIDGIPLPLRQLRDGLGTFALIQAHAGKLFQRPILIAGMLIEGEDDAVFAVALDIHVNAIGVGAGFLAKRMRFVVSQRRLAHGQFARKLAVRAGQHPGRAFGQHVGQGVRRFRIFGRERQRRGVDALLLVLSLSMIEIDMIDRQLVFDLIGRAQVDDDGAEIVGRLAHVGAGQIVKGHLAFLGGREGKGIAIAAEALPTGMRVSLVRGQRRQGDV